MKREIIENIRFATDIFWGEDYLFNYTFFKSSSKMVHVISQLYFYRQHISSVTKSGFSPKKATRVLSRYRISQLYKDDKALYEKSLALLGYTYYEMLEWFFYNSDFRKRESESGRKYINIFIKGYRKYFKHIKKNERNKKMMLMYFFPYLTMYVFKFADKITKDLKR